MARGRAERRRPARGKGHADALSARRQVRVVRGRGDLPVPRRAASRTSDRADLSSLRTHLVPAADVLRGMLPADGCVDVHPRYGADRKSTRLNSSHVAISYAVFCLKNKKM